MFKLLAAVIFAPFLLSSDVAREIVGERLDRRGLTLTFSEEFDTFRFDGSDSFRPVNGHLATHLNGDWVPANNWKNPWARTLHHKQRGEDQWYVDPRVLRAFAGDIPESRRYSPFRVRDGVLTITARRLPRAMVDRLSRIGRHRGWTAVEARKHWASGVLMTSRSFAQQYGVFEMRARLPHEAGAWPAFWLLKEPTNASPPEIDIVDNYFSSDAFRLVSGGKSRQGGFGPPKTNGRDGVVFDEPVAGVWRTFTVEWTAQHITYYLDDVAYFRVATPPDLHIPMYPIVNLAVIGPGFAWADQPRRGLRTIRLQIDWIRVWRRT